MRVQKVFGVVMLLVLLLILSSCSDSKGVSMEQLKTDINAREEIQEIFLEDTENNTKYEITKCEIEKEQINIDDKEDIIYCNATVENDMFRAVLSIKTLYNYYDKGGWVLDEFTCDLSDYYAKKCPSLELMDTMMYGLWLSGTPGDDDINARYVRGDVHTIERPPAYNFSSGDFIVKDSSLDDESKVARYNCEFISEFIDMECYIEFELTKEGWQAKKYNTDNEMYAGVIITEYETDYSSLLGDYYNSGDRYAKLSILEITEDKIIYSIITDDEYLMDHTETGENIKGDFDEFGICFSPIDDIEGCDDFSYKHSGDYWKFEYIFEFVREK